MANTEFAVPEIKKRHRGPGKVIPMPRQRKWTMETLEARITMTLAEKKNISARIRLLMHQNTLPDPERDAELETLRSKVDDINRDLSSIRSIKYRRLKEKREIDAERD